MTKQSRDWLSDILIKLLHECDHEPDEITKYVVIDQSEFIPKAKQAILSKTKEQVLELLPEKRNENFGNDRDISGRAFNAAIDQMKANIRKGKL